MESHLAAGSRSGPDLVQTQPDLAQGRAGLRFCRAEEERRYRDWYLDEARAVAIAAFASAAGMWLGALIAVSLVFDVGLRQGGPICIGLIANNSLA